MSELSVVIPALSEADNLEEFYCPAEGCCAGCGDHCRERWLFGPYAGRV